MAEIPRDHTDIFEPEVAAATGDASGKDPNRQTRSGVFGRAQAIVNEACARQPKPPAVIGASPSDAAAQEAQRLMDQAANREAAAARDAVAPLREAPRSKASPSAAAKSVPAALPRTPATAVQKRKKAAVPASTHPPFIADVVSGPAPAVVKPTEAAPERDESKPIRTVADL